MLTGKTREREGESPKIRVKPLRVMWWIFKLPFRFSYWLLRRGWSGLRRLPPRITRSLPEFPRELHRPAVFTLMFWSAFVLTCLSWPFLRADSGAATVYGLLPTVVVLAALYGLWTALPWNPGASPTRKLVAPALVVGVFVLDRAVSGAGLMFYPVLFANGVFLFGFRRGIGYILAILAVIFVDMMLITSVIDVSASASSVFGNSLLITVLFALVAVFVVGVCASIIEAVQRREESEALLSKLETAHADLKEYAGRVRELTVSEERARMAREMHDSVGHYLTVVNVQLEAANKFMDGSETDDAEKARAEVKKAKRLASEALSEVRRSVRALKPLAVERAGSTSDMLGELVRDFEGNGPSVSLSVSGEERDLPAEIEVALYRTLQESLTNVLKHSKARAVRVSLDFDPARVNLRVEDDGEGAPPETEKSGFGLRALHEQASELGGKLEFGAAPEGGFIVEVSLPTGGV